MEYETPPLYLGIHILSGMISYFYPVLMILFLSYQLFQWICNVRFFFFSWEIKEGNSTFYTFYKIMQYVVGYLMVYIYFNVFNSNA